MARAESDVAEREVMVPEGSNAVVVRARDHEWVALLRGGAEVVREHAGSRETTFIVSAGTYTVRADGRIDSAKAATIDVPTDPLAFAAGPAPLLLRLSSDAPDRHVIDGVGEIPADGESSCTITIEKVDAAGQPLRRRRDNDEVFLRSTGGTIVDARGKERIRSVRLQSGRAAFRLVSEASPRLVTVSALGEGSPSAAELQAEFV